MACQGAAGVPSNPQSTPADDKITCSGNSDAQAVSNRRRSWLALPYICCTAASCDTAGNTHGLQQHKLPLQKLQCYKLLQHRLLQNLLLLLLEPVVAAVSYLQVCIILH